MNPKEQERKRKRKGWHVLHPQTKMDVCERTPTAFTQIPRLDDEFVRRTDQMCA